MKKEIKVKLCFCVVTTDNVGQVIYTFDEKKHAEEMYDKICEELNNSKK